MALRVSEALWKQLSGIKIEENTPPTVTPTAASKSGTAPADPAPTPESLPTAESASDLSAPATSKKQQELSTAFSPSTRDIQRHFWPTPIIIEYPPKTPNGGVKIRRKHQEAHTLNATEAEPNVLKYVLLLPDAHHPWDKEHTVWANTDLHFLRLPDSPGPFGRDALRHLDPVPVWKQVKTGTIFMGYHRVTHAVFHEPQSTPVVQMLNKKWDELDVAAEDKPGGFDMERKMTHLREKWAKDMDKKWVQVTFEADETTNTTLSAPDIKVLRVLENDLSCMTNKGYSVKQNVNGVL